MKQFPTEDVIASLTPIFIALIGATAGTAIVFSILSSDTLKEEARGIALGGAIGIVVTGLSNAGSLASPLSSNQKRSREDESQSIGNQFDKGV